MSNTCNINGSCYSGTGCKNVYKGKRYVPKIIGAWDNTRQSSYESLSVVTWEGNSYTSKKDVPIGVDITNSDYWVLTGNYNLQIENYRQEVEEYKKNVIELCKQFEEFKVKVNNEIRSKISVSYREFGAKLNGIDDDTIPIKNCHEFANSNNVPVKNSGGKILITDTIDVETSVDLGGATLITNNKNMDKTLYRIVNKNEWSNISQNCIPKAQLLRDSSLIPAINEIENENCFFRIITQNILGYRYGDSTDGKNKEDVFIHVKNGIILGRLLFDLTKDSVTMVKRKINNNKLIFENFKVQWNEEEFTCNIITCERDNVTLQNVETNITKQNVNKYANNLFYFVDCFNITIKNILGSNIATDKIGGYVIELRRCVNVVMDKLNLIDGWGVIGTNYVKNVKVVNCNLNRYDVHLGCGDTVIENSTFIGGYPINIGWGRGTFTIKNCVKEHIIGNNNNSDVQFVDLRADYGGCFEGTIDIDNIYYNNNNCSSPVILYYSQGFRGDSLFFKDIEFPSNINITNVKYNTLIDSLLTGVIIDTTGYKAQTKKPFFNSVINIKNVYCGNESDSKYFMGYTCNSDYMAYAHGGNITFNLENLNKKISDFYNNPLQFTEIPTRNNSRKKVIDIAEDYGKIKLNILLNNCYGSAYIKAKNSPKVEILNSHLSNFICGVNSDTIAEELKIYNSKIIPLTNSVGDTQLFQLQNSNLQNNLIYSYKINNNLCDLQVGGKENAILINNLIVTEQSFSQDVANIYYKNFPNNVKKPSI